MAGAHGRMLTQDARQETRNDQAKVLLVASYCSRRLVLLLLALETVLWEAVPVGPDASMPSRIHDVNSAVLRLASQS